MGKLDDGIGYLAGPIRYAKDAGVGWRREFTRLAEEKGLKLKLIDPTTDKGIAAENVERIKDMVMWQEWDALSELMWQISRNDLRRVDYADFVILYVDKDIHMCGTYFEVSTACNQKKPILTIVEGGKESCPPWLFGMLNHHDMFETVEECVERLCKLDSGEMGMDRTWVLLR